MAADGPRSRISSRSETSLPSLPAADRRPFAATRTVARKAPPREGYRQMLPRPMARSRATRGSPVAGPRTARVDEKVAPIIIEPAPRRSKQPPSDNSPITGRPSRRAASRFLRQSGLLVLVRSSVVAKKGGKCRAVRDAAGFQIRSQKPGSVVDLPGSLARFVVSLVVSPDSLAGGRRMGCNRATDARGPGRRGQDTPRTRKG